MTVFEQLLAAFLAAHFTGDFLLQTDRDIANKTRPGVLLKHGVTHALLVLTFSGTWTVWLPALSIACVHVAIDFGKQILSKGTWRSFLMDQALHLLVLLAAAWLSARHGLIEPSLWRELFGDAYFRVAAGLAGLIATVPAGAYFVDMAVEPFLAQIRAGRTARGGGRATERKVEAGRTGARTAEREFEAGRTGARTAEREFEAVERSAGERLRGLRDGGRAIGQLERALIFVFVLIDQFSAIGFLIAAKSVFRFGELRDRSNRMEAEYIIIGTLISFLWAIAAALLTRLLAGL